ncbi:sensor histidine kinase [Herbidospora sp. RD11066]
MRKPTPGPVLLAVAVTALPPAALIDMRVPADHRAVLLLQPGAFDSLAGIALAAAGMIVLSRFPRHALGLLLSFFGAWWSIDGLASSWLAYSTLEGLPGGSAAFLVYQRFGAGLLLMLPLLLLLFPDGRLPSGRWRVVSLASLALTALLPLALVSAPSQIAQATSEPGPIPAPLRGLNLDLLYLPFPDEVWTVVLRVAQFGVPLSLVAPFVVVVRRYRGSAGIDRMRLRWLVWAGVVDLMSVLTFRLLPHSWTALGLTVGVVLTAAAVAIGIVRPDLVDVDRLLGGTVVYALLLAVTFVLDLVVLGSVGQYLGSRLNDGERLVIAVFAVAIAYAQLRGRLWRLVRRWVMGDRDDPYHVVSGLAERLEATDDTEAQLLTLARTVRKAFRSSYVGVEITDALLVEDGERPAETRALPIAYRGERIGRLVLPARVTRPTSGDERLLADVIRQAAAAARAVHLAEELQRGRERIVSAVEDERRRLRRELHDGLGPTLAAVAARIDMARITARRSGDDADQILGQARQELTGLLAEVRRLVHGLRPPALDDVGLVGAIRQLGPGLTMRVEEHGDLTGLPAAVEVAAYRIAAEAITNVRRHAQATTCVVTLTRANGVLDVEITDDGVGLTPGAATGVGLVSMRERAAELGGTCVIAPAEPSGTRVLTRLPARDEVTV